MIPSGPYPNGRGAAAARRPAAPSTMAKKFPSDAQALPALTPTRPSKDLQVFANPAPQRDYLIRFEVPEFTCLCPLTGQPDFAHFTIEIVPDRRCVELKSLKMYFWSYRDEGAFHERVTNIVLDDLVRAIAPRFARISADWFVRGGIHTRIVAEHRKRGWTPAPEIALPGPAGDGTALR